MKSLFCKVSAIAALAMLLSVPAMAADQAVFQLGQPVTVGAVELPAGEYTFRALDRGLVLVYDATQTKLVASSLALKTSLPAADLETSGTLSHDWAVRTLSLGDFRYTFPESRQPASKVAQNASTTTVVAMAR